MVGVHAAEVLLQSECDQIRTLQNCVTRPSKKPRRGDLKTVVVKSCSGSILRQRDFALPSKSLILLRFSICTANNFEFMYSLQRISLNSFPKFIYIFPKSFMIFQQEYHGVTKRCRLPLLTNGALVIRVQMRGRECVGGFSQCVQLCTSHDLEPK
jgi:hypothetical protein